MGHAQRKTFPQVFSSVMIGTALPFGLKAIGLDPAHASAAIQVVLLFENYFQCSAAERDLEIQPLVKVELRHSFLRRLKDMKSVTADASFLESG